MTWKMINRNSLVLIFVAAILLPLAVRAGEDVEISSAAVTALSCAQEAKKTGNLELLSSCPMSEALKGYVIFDVAEKKIYLLSEKNIYLHELEKAYGGGSIDVEGEIVAKRDSIPVIEVKEYSVNARPKPGAFKGCL